jgi:hypothetical protein
VAQTKPTTEEYQDRIEFVRSLLVRRVPKHTIKKLVRLQFAVDLRHEPIERYITRAREQILLDLDRGRDEFRSESKALYESILADTKAKHGDRIKAQERIDKLLGLEAPTRNLHGNDPENPLPVPILRIVKPAAGAPSPEAVNGHSNGRR